MHRALLALPLLALSFTTACDAEESNGEFRAVPLAQSEPLDIGLQLFQEAGDGDGTVIWDIKEVGVHDGDSSQGAPLLLTFGEDGEIFDDSGVHTCTLNAPYLNKKVHQVTSVDGDEVLYTVFENFVFSGEVHPAKLTAGNIRRMDPLFTLSGNEIYRGRLEDGKLLASANDDLTIQDLNTKLLIGALIEGECGSNGLPGYGD